MMKTCLYATARLDGFDCNNESYAERYKKYLDYYRGIKTELGWDEIYLTENGSKWESIKPFIADDFFFYRYFENLKRGDVFDYPYCWRALYHVRRLLKNYDKILLIDTDSFVLSGRLAEYIKGLNSGWTALWCDRYGFPETNCQVLCRDAFDYFIEFTEGDFLKHNGKCMELTLPFIHIEKGFHSDRFGEDETPQNDGMDFYSQCRLKTKMTFVA